MVHRPAPSRNCSEFRKMQLGLCSRRRGYPMPSHYCTSCIGCQSSSGSHKSWHFWYTKVGARPLRLTWTTKSQNMSSAELYIHLPSCCCSNRSPGQTFPGVLSDFRHRVSGTGCHKQFSSVTLLSVFKSGLTTFVFTQAFTEHWFDLPPVPLNFLPYGAIEIWLLLYYYFYGHELIGVFI